MQQDKQPNELPILSDLTPGAAERADAPRNYGPPGQWNGHARITGPCGDTMEYWVYIQGREVTQIGFTTDGCGASRAAGSMAGELALGKSVDAVKNIEQKDVLSALGGLPDEHVHCGLLAANTLKASVGAWENASAEN